MTGIDLEMSWINHLKRVRSRAISETDNCRQRASRGYIHSAFNSCEARMRGHLHTAP